MKFLTTVLFFTFLFSGLQAQEKNLSIAFVAKINGKKLILNEEGQDIKISQLKFYISNIELFKDGKSVFIFPKAFLLDYAEAESLHEDCSLNFNFDEVSFDVGIDSPTNAAGAQSGALDPANGMYWTWQSGYINVKLEGQSSACPTRKNEFRFHLGGFLEPYQAHQKMRFMVDNSQKITFLLDLDLFFEKINLAKVNRIMSPSAAAVNLSKLFANCLSIK